MKTVGILRSFTLTFLTIAVALLFLMRASPASARPLSTKALVPAGNCLQDEYSLTAKQKLSCTANDVRIASVTNIRHLDGKPFPACNLGDTVSFLADFTIVTSSKSSRSNIGLYFGTASQGTALTGACTDSIIAPQHSCPSDPSIMCGSDNYHELDNGGALSPDNCGDTSSTDLSPTTGATGTQLVTVEIDNFLCQPPTGQTALVLPNCTSWQVPGTTTLCESPSPDFPFPFDANGLPEAVPGSPSKCNCGVLPLNIQIQTPTVSVTKNCSTANGAGTLPNPSCTLDDTGSPGTVTYTVDVSNISGFGSLTLDQICDTAYGTIKTAAGYSGICAAGTVGSITGTTCSLPQTIAKGSDYSCTFTASQAENTAVTDTASAKGVGSDNVTPFGPTNSNSVTVTAAEADSAAADIKTSANATPTSGCATVRYNVEVDNTSAAGTDEVETLSALNDSVYGSITSVHGDVLGTTCGVATGAAGSGTLSGSTGGGVLPATLAVNTGKYTCQFDGKMCSNALVALINPPNATNCAAGVELKDTVSGTITADEGAGDVVTTQSPGNLTVDVCFSTTEATK